MPTEPLHKTLKHLWIPPNVSPGDGDAVASLNHAYNFQSGCCRNFLHIILCLDKECSYHLSPLQCVKWTPTSNMLFNKESHSAPACLNVIAFKSPPRLPAPSCWAVPMLLLVLVRPAQAAASTTSCMPGRGGGGARSTPRQWYLGHSMDLTMDRIMDAMDLTIDLIMDLTKGT